MRISDWSSDVCSSDLMLEPLFAARMNLTVAGRYLFLREESLSGRDKRGFIDVRHYDCRTVHALSNCVAVIEQVCNIPQGSTLDYTADGPPILQDSGFTSPQTGLRSKVPAPSLPHPQNAQARW